MSDEQYFARQPKSKSTLSPSGAPKRDQRITWKVGTTELHMTTDSGVFSRQGIDAGSTRTLPTTDTYTSLLTSDESN